MILKVLFIQRKCSYDGEFAPEALCCVDEYSIEDNPEWFETEVNRQITCCEEDISSHSVIEIEIDQEKLSSILNNNPTIQGEIK